MKRPLIILHGWSDTSGSFKPIADWFRSQGIVTHDLFLGDYISLHDSVRLTDLGHAFQRALEHNKISTKRHAFDLVVHSTGGLVAREFLLQFCAGDASKTPVRHLIMLAPANFGSPLAAMGKSMIGRLIKGWKWDGAFQTGTQVLDALELASNYSFDLALQDLFDPQFPIFAPDNTQATVLTGTCAYAAKLRQFVHEDGSDGTVRVSTANLNAHHYQVDFKDPNAPQMYAIKRNTDQIAFAVLPLDHSSITRPDLCDPLKDLILSAINAESAAQYAKHLAACSDVTATTYIEGLKTANEDWFHRYMHVVIRVRDQFGMPIDDYFIEFYQETGDRNDQVFTAIHEDVLEKVSRNNRTPHCRSFLFDIDALEAFIKRRPKTLVEMSLVAADDSALICHRNPDNQPGAGVPVFGRGKNNFSHPNCPVLVDITLYRDPAPKVLKLKKTR